MFQLFSSPHVIVVLLLCVSDQDENCIAPLVPPNTFEFDTVVAQFYKSDRLVRSKYNVIKVQRIQVRCVCAALAVAAALTSPPTPPPRGPCCVLVRHTWPQNRILWGRYQRQRYVMASLNGVDKVNERSLFHGTKDLPPSVIYDGVIGFDARMTREGNFYGRGVYFAEAAAYVEGARSCAQCQGGTCLCVRAPL
jgi:hypothetical protein